MIKIISKIKIQFLLLSLFLAFSVSAFAQTEMPKLILAGKFQNRFLNSKLMEREMPYNLLLPKNYNEAAQKETRYPVIYLLHGLTGHYNNWAEQYKTEQYAANYNFIIVMPEGNNGWYTDSATVSNDKYESYIIKELIPEIDKKYRTKTVAAKSCNCRTFNGRLRFDKIRFEISRNVCARRFI